MKRLIPALAVVVVLATGVSFALAHWTMTRQPTAANLHDAAWLKRELKLSDAQAVEIGKSETAFRAQLDAACASHCAARMALGKEIAKPKPDPEKCRAAVEKMNAVQTESERATLDHILKVRTLLDEQQAQHYSKLIRDQVCNMPMGAP
jgi:predicted negative regulator of RcsB-dependent stress response